jgi:hypothetical protein
LVSIYTPSAKEGKSGYFEKQILPEDPNIKAWYPVHIISEIHSCVKQQAINSSRIKLPESDDE